MNDHRTVQAWLMLLILIIVSLFSPAFAQVHTWTDKNGNIVISDTPPPGAMRQERDGGDRVFQTAPTSDGTPKPSAVEPERAARGVEERRLRQPRDVQVIMYMTDWCGYCRKARAYIEELGATLIEYNIDREPERREEMLRKSGGSRGVPLIDVEGVIIRGFSPPAIKSAIEERMRS